MGKKVTRLFEQFHPEHYVLKLDVDREQMVFSGNVTITGKKAGRPSERLTFHQKGLKVTSATIIKHDKSGDQPVSVTRINNQDSFDEVRLHADKSLYPGEYTITMEFEGEITRPMNGIYPCFFEHDGQEKKLIATQFESHHAREAFPCIDEPEAKATFDLTLISPNGEPAIANTPVKEQKTLGQKQSTSFETTPRMSTYLLAFVFGDMEYLEAKTKDGVLVRTYATPGKAEFAQFGLDVAVRCLEFFSDYFKLPYPLQKLDMAALPDFSSGAMENWGLVTYREVAMLTDPKTSSIESRQLVALVICHELSHQWFGNLVTMKWWDDLWLNESFANMMEYRAVDALFPEWNIWEQFVSHEMTSAKRRDSILDVQSVRTGVNHPDEISTIFDPSIVYAKGGSILYMLLNHIGEDNFRSGLQTYFKKHAYGNTEAGDLWQALGDASGQDINSFMQKWLAKPGYPIVSVDWQPGTKELALSQKRFLSDPMADAKDSEPWKVPLAATVELSPSVLEKVQSKAQIIKEETPLILNHDGHGYFLPQYTQEAHLAQIIKAIADDKVSTLDRYLLLDNYILLQRGGYSQTTNLLDMLKAYANEDSETVWGAISLSIGEVRKLVENNDAADKKLDKLLATLVTNSAEQLGWDDKPGDTVQTLRLRGLIMALATGAKTTAVIDEALAHFAKFKKPSDLSPSTRGAVYFAAVRYGTDDDFQRLINLHTSVTSADEREEIAAGLSSAKTPDRYNTLIEMLKSPHIRRQDLLHWYAWLLRNRYSRTATWDWMTSNWDWILQEFSSDKSFNYFARFGGNVFSTKAEYDKFVDFFEPKASIVALNREINLAKQEIISRIAWRQRNEKAVVDWLTK